MEGKPTECSKDYVEESWEDYHGVSLIKTTADIAISSLHDLALDCTSLNSRF